MQRLIQAISQAISEQSSDPTTPNASFNPFVTYFISPFWCFVYSWRSLSIGLLPLHLLAGLHLFHYINDLWFAHCLSFVIETSTHFRCCIFLSSWACIQIPTCIFTCRILVRLYQWLNAMGSFGLFVSSQFIETFSTVIQGHSTYSEAGMSLFEYSMAFREIQTESNNGIYTEQVIVFCFICSLMLLMTHISGAFNLQDYRLIPSAFFH